MVKVADFGLAENIDTTKEYFRQDMDNAIKLPIKWLALESINNGVFSEKSDVVNTYYYYKDLYCMKHDINYFYYCCAKFRE